MRTRLASLALLAVAFAAPSSWRTAAEAAFDAATNHAYASDDGLNLAARVDVSKRALADSQDAFVSAARALR